MMRPIAAAAFLIACLTAGLARADADVSVSVAPLSSGVLPDDRVLIRNASGYTLSVWISAKTGGGWKRYEIGPELSVLIERRGVAAAIATTDGDDDPRGKAPPPVAPGDIGGTRLVRGAFHYAKLEGGTRAIFCWAAAKDRWMVQAFGEEVCG